MLIQGEKYACEACVRGHRVSNCQHFERPLQHINKKGRPVTQCQHCRSQRKNRSAHVKCDCGEKTTKCVHLGAKDGHRESCCCNHGGDCSCAGFKNELDPVPETASSGSEADVHTSSCGSAPTPTTTCAVPKSPVRRSRANTSRSEGTLTFDENGRHKPLTQKHAKAASRKTLPYPTSRMSMTRSASHSHLNGYMLGTSFNDDEDLDDILSNGNTGSESGADEALAHNSSAAGASSAAGSSYIPAQLSQQQRRSRSEADSPSFFASSFPLPNQMCSNLTLSMNGVGAYSTSSSTSFNPFSGDSLDQPLFSAGINPPSVDWANLGLDFDRGFDAGSEGLADSLSFSHNAAYDIENNAPTMTTGTSGEVSEADDNFGPPDFEHEFETDFESHADTASSMAFSRVNSGLHLSNPVLLGQTASLGGDSGELRHSKAGNKFLPTPLAGAGAGAVAVDDISNLTMFQDDDQHLWVNEYHGLPTMTESPEPDNGIPYWSA
ncbi:copper fist dna binding domain-containing protein [Ophiostoma piceae UAMH 11346]|uniref:Copper fist dna binding domain-containing protein n=1 Tax=Ophiostoma piceae (strain UAMH 11346) TaxID=1262450 RepID=S3CN92_OPHP1|nr:copper fist dna binding domain-containing protein [Ophiostoma piceae UAMH 11346]